MKILEEQLYILMKADLPKLPSKSILVMDNASFYKSKSMQEEIKVAGHTLEYLPPYSPDLNPIEHKWVQAKSKRRRYQCGIDEFFRELYPRGKEVYNINVCMISGKLYGFLRDLRFYV